MEDLRKSEKGVEAKKLHNDVDVPEMVMAAVAECGLENSMEHAKRKAGIPENVGNASDWDGIIAEKEGDNDMDRIYVDSNLKDDIHPILNPSGGSQTDELQSNEKEYEAGKVEFKGEGINLDGLISFKTWPTWKRLAHIECGPDDSFNFTLPSLGKRGMLQQECSAKLEADEQARGKLNEELSQNSQTARVSIHPRRAQQGY